MIKWTDGCKMDPFEEVVEKMFEFRHQLFAFAVVGLLSLFGFSTKAAIAEAADTRKPEKVQPGDSLEEMIKRVEGNVDRWKKQEFLQDYYFTISQTLTFVLPYQVAEGDQLDKIAQQYNTTQFAIKNLNHLEYDRLETGMVLSIPVNSNRLIKRPLETPKTAPAVIKSNASQQREGDRKAKKDVKQTSVNQKKKYSQVKPTVKSKVSTMTAGKRTVNMKASAYNVQGNEKWGRLTASGTTVRHGVVAVDPNVIPLGTKLFISGYHSPLLPEGGFIAIAEDTGGAIKGNRIDIFIDAPTEIVRNFGIQNVKVTILK